jgi:hypothetical protein
MAGRARAAVGSKALKERTLLVDRTIEVQGSDDTGAVEEQLQALRRGLVRARSAAECARDCESDDRNESTGIHYVYL